MSLAPESFLKLESKDFQSLSQFRDWARGLTKCLSRPCLFLLSGDLSAGKTELVKTLVAQMQVSPSSEEVSSPTFALQHSYKTSSGIVDHWDLYRLEGEDELESSGFWDQLNDPQICLFVEWPERLRLEWLPKHLNVYLVEILKLKDDEKNGDEARRVSLFKRP